MAVYIDSRLCSKAAMFMRLGLALTSVYWLINLLLYYPNFSGQHADGPQVGKVTMVYGNKSVYERAVNTHIIHSRRLGYPHFILRRPVLEGVWNKYAALLMVLLKELEKPPEQQLGWLFWTDADTVLMNPDIPLEIFLPPSDRLDIHLLLTKDWNGMNNGVFFLRVCPWSVELLSAAISYPVINPDIELFWPDQSALNNILQSNRYFSKAVIYCPLRWFNAYMGLPNGEGLNLESPEYFQVHQGDLLVHFPGTPHNELDDRLGPYLEIAEHGAWEKSLEDTDYIQEIEAFWRRPMI